jgi:hypothetical protein
MAQARRLEFERRQDLEQAGSRRAMPLPFFEDILEDKAHWRVRRKDGWPSG